MQITVNITHWDLIKFILAIIATKTMLLIYLAFFIFIYMFLLNIINNDGASIVNTIMYILLFMVSLMTTIGLIILIFILCITYTLILAYIKKDILGEHLYTLNSQGLIEETEFNHITHSWSEVKDIQIKYGLLLIQVIRKNNIYQKLRIVLLFHIFPKSSFSTEQEFNAFYNQAEQYWLSSIESSN